MGEREVDSRAGGLGEGFMVDGETRENFAVEEVKQEL